MRLLVSGCLGLVELRLLGLLRLLRLLGLLRLLCLLCLLRLKVRQQELLLLRGNLLPPRLPELLMRNLDEVAVLFGVRRPKYLMGNGGRQACSAGNGVRRRSRLPRP